MNLLEAANKVVQGAVESQHGKLEQLTNDVKIGLDRVHGADIGRDADLRKELIGMARQLEEGHKRLQDMISSGPATVPPPMPMTYGGALGERVRDVGERIEKQFEWRTEALRS